MCLLTKSWCFFNYGFYFISVAFWFIFIFVYHSLWPGLLGNTTDETDGVYGVFDMIAVAVPYWFSMVRNPKPETRNQKI